MSGKVTQMSSNDPAVKAETGTSDQVKIDYRDSDNLIGRLLTYVDATYQDKEQREAHKGIVRRQIKDWMVDLYREQYPDTPRYHF